MVQDLAVEAPESTGTQAQRTSIAVKFLLGWAGSVVLLILVALVTNIEWARPHLEAALQESFKRPAKLGRLSWHLGLNGLSIDTNGFILHGKDGEQFIQAKHSEMGVAFLPLFQQRVIIKHVAFKSPEVWAVKESEDRWNFSDLLTEGPEIHLVQIEDGKLHLTNNVPAATWKKYELNNIDLKFGFPHKRKATWPLYFDCKIPVERNGEVFVSRVKLSATGSGPYEEWQSRPYSFSLELLDFNPGDFRSLIGVLPDIDGRFSGKLSGSGVLKDGLEAVVSGAVTALKLPAANQQALAELPSVIAESKVILMPDSILWQDADLKLDSWQVKCAGSLKSTDNHVKYHTRLEGELGDLQGLYGRVLSRFFPLESEGLKRFANPAAVGRGNAKFALQLEGVDDKIGLASTVKARGIPLRDLLEAGMKEYAAFLPDLKPDSPVSGEIKVIHGHALPTARATAGSGTASGASRQGPSPVKFSSSGAKSGSPVFPAGSKEKVSANQNSGEHTIVEVRDLSVPFENTVIRMNGHMDGTLNEGAVEFSIKNLNAAGLKKLPKQALNDEARSLLKVERLKGALDLRGKVVVHGAVRKVDVETHLNGVSLRSSTGALLAENIAGTLKFDGEKLLLDKIRGTLPSKNAPHGEFNVSGHVAGGPDKTVAIQLQGKQIDLSRLRDLARESGVPLNGSIAGVPLDHVSGKLQQLVVHASGPAPAPELTFHISGPNLQVERADAHGAARTFHLTSGTIDHKDGLTQIKDVVVGSSHGGDFKLSARLEGPLEQGKLKYIAIATDGIELAEWRMLLPPSLLPAELLDSLPPAFRPVKNASVQGRLNGDIKITELSSGYEVDGVFAFQNAGTKLGAKMVPLEKLTGLIAFSSNQVIVQELTGYYGRSSFLLDGLIADYRKSFNWHGQLKGRFYPEELAAIARATGTGLDLSSTERRPLALRLSGSGLPDDYKLFFNGRAEPHDGLRLSLGSVELHQPNDLPLTFDGAVQVKNAGVSSIELDRCMAVVGTHALTFQGTLKSDGKRGNVADLKLTTSQGMPVQLLADMLYPGKVQNAHGQVDLSLSFLGAVESPHVSGSLKLSDVDVPDMSLTNLNARIDLPDFTWRPKAGEQTVASKLTLSSAKIAGFDLRDGEAQLVTSAGEYPRFTLEHGHAKIAGGRINFGGFLEPDTRKYRAELSMNKLAVGEFVADILKGDGKVSGTADVNLVLHGETGPSWLKNLNGEGQFKVSAGTIQGVGKLQGKLQGANLLQQGLLGFNINNFVQAVFPNKSGAFKEIDGELSIANGIVGLPHVRYNGNDLRMRAAGHVNLPAGTVAIDVAGDIPRVASSILPGAVGEMSREMTLQKLLGIVTFKQLEDLPSLPLLGDISSDHPRVFSFVVHAPLDKPELISRSVEKTFKWLPQKPYATPHPVPGLTGLD